MIPQHEIVNITLKLQGFETPAKVTLHALCGLITLFRSLGEQLQHDVRDGSRDALHSIPRRSGLFGDVTMNPFHGLGSRERKTASQKFVERDAKRIQIASRV